MLYHNQKFLGMKFFVGQVEYFGKNCMGVLDPMEVWWEESIDGSQKKFFFLKTMLSQGMFDRIIFKCVPLFIKYNIF